MKFKSLVAAAALAAATCIGGSVSAATVAGVISSADDNDALGPLGLSDPLNGYYGGQLYLVGGSADIQVSYLGAEAGNNNYFSFGSILFNTPGIASWTAGGAQDTITVAAGLLSFWFGADQNAASVTNGSNPDNTNPNLPNFFVSFLPDQNSTSGQSVLLFLDDGGGGSDDNHDDMVIRLTIVGGDGYIAPIPLPAGGLLLIGALGGLAALRRRKSA